MAGRRIKVEQVMTWEMLRLSQSYVSKLWMDFGAEAVSPAVVLCFRGAWSVGESSWLELRGFKV